MSFVSYPSLERFGKLVADELTNMFKPKSMIVIPMTESMAQNLCCNNELNYKCVVSDFIKYFRNSTVSNNYCNLSSCVFQVIIAYKCVSSCIAAYNEAFSNFLGISTADLQSVYSNFVYCNSWEPKQEVLWKKTKDFLKKQYDLNLCIPKPKYLAGRYVQYPRSQQLFSLTDFQRYNERFEGLRLSHEESYSFEYFSSLMFSKNECVCTCKSLLDLERDQLENIAREIIFYCFCNWVEKEIKKRGVYNTNKTRKDSEQDQITIRLDTTKRKYSIYLNGKKQLKYKLIQDKILEKPFIYMEAYGDWSLARKVSQEDSVGVCIHPKKRQAFIEILKGGMIFTSFEDSSIEFISLSPNNWQNVPSNWKQSLESNSFLVGGIKDENGFYLSGLLPFVLKENETSKNYFFVDTTRYDFSTTFFDLNTCNLQPGIHYLKLPNCSMSELKVTDRVLNSKLDKGWSFEKLPPFFCSVSTEWMLSGLNVLTKLKTNNPSYWGNDKMEQVVYRFDKLRTHQVKMWEERWKHSLH